MKKIVKGNDFTLKIPVSKMVEGQAQAFPLPACTDVVVQVCNQFRRTPLAFEIGVKEDNVLLARVEGDKMSIGTYAIEVKGKIFGNDWRSNEYPQFAIVANNADADTEFGETDEGDNSVEMDTAIVILPPSVELSDLINKANDALKTNKETNDTLNTNEEARKKEEEARVIAEQKRTDAEQSRVTAETKREADFATSKKACDDATNKALSTYSHPPYVDADGYYYKWNVSTGSYDKTDVNLTGKAFQIKKVFSSVSAMNATDVNTFAENDFVLINTVNVEDEDNAKLYVVALNEQGQKFYSYLVDMSGFRGFTGKTPQIVIGSVNTLAPGSSASASLVANGTDASGNPVYTLNFAIPKGEKITLADLTEDEIKLLQKPANDAIVACNDATGKANAATLAANTAAAKANAAADDAISKSAEVGKLNSKVAADEEDRVRAESGRVSAENERVDAETTRKQAETDRAAAEDTRVEAEQSRADAETKRESDFDVAIKAAETATAGAEKVDAALTEENVFEVTDRTGVKKTLDLSGMVHAQSDIARIQESMGAYSDRPDITLVAKETNKAISADGIKVAKTGWAIAEFTAEKGNIYLFKPNEVDGDVCIFAEEITNIETRGIDYTYTYNTDGAIETAKATYLGKTHTYTFTYAEDKSYTITDEAGETVEALPMTYETKVGSYFPLVRLNADTELPIDGYCRYMSHFKGNSSIKIVVSYKIDAADLVMKVVRDGVFASISTQLGNLSQKEDETRKKIEDLHGNYIELMWNADSWCNVDGKWVEVKAFKKYRFKPIFDLITFNGDLTHYPNGNHLVYANIPHLDVSKFVYTNAEDGYKKQIRILFRESKIDKLDCRGMNVSGLQSINQIFEECTELRELDIRGWDISECKTFSDTQKNSYSHSLFTRCYKLQCIYGLSGLNTRNIEDFTDLFYGCRSLTSIDVSKWVTSKATRMRKMFNGCFSLTSLDVSNFDTSNVTDMGGMFEDLNSLQKLDISNFDTRKVTLIKGTYGFISSDSLLILDMSGDNFTFENVKSFGRYIANAPKLRTLKLGKNFFKMHESITSLSLSYPYWTDSSVKLSLVTNLYDRKANGLPDLTLTLHATTKKVLSEDDMAAITAKGYIIA